MLFAAVFFISETYSDNKTSCVRFKSNNSFFGIKILESKSKASHYSSYDEANLYNKRERWQRQKMHFNDIVFLDVVVLLLCVHIYLSYVPSSGVTLVTF